MQWCHKMSMRRLSWLWKEGALRSKFKWRKVMKRFFYWVLPKAQELRLNTAGDSSLISTRRCFNVLLKWKLQHSLASIALTEGINWRPLTEVQKILIANKTRFGEWQADGEWGKVKEDPKVKLHEAAEPVDQRQNLGICFVHELDCTADPPSQERRCFPEHLILCSSEQSGCPTQIFTLFTIFLSTWQLPPALVLCSGSPLLPFFFQLPSYSLIIYGLTRPKLTLSQPISVTHSIFSSPRFLFSPSHRPQAPNKKKPKKDFLIAFRVWSLSMPTPEFKDFALNIFSPASLDVSLTIVWLMARAQWRKWAQPQPEIQYEFQCELTTYSL